MVELSLEDLVSIENLVPKSNNTCLVLNFHLAVGNFEEAKRILLEESKKGFGPETKPYLVSLLREKSLLSEEDSKKLGNLLKMKCIKGSLQTM